MKKMIIFFSFLMIFLPSSTALTLDGPLQVKNQFPLFLYVNAQYLESAFIENSFIASLSYSSVYLVRNSSEWDIELDMEIAGLNLRFRKNIKDFIELGIDLPIISFNAGFMDGFFNSYHDTFGFPDYGRKNRPDNEFLYEVRRNGDLVVKGKNGHIGIGDIRLTFKKPLLNGDPAISIKGEIELPTGDPKTGFGNGNFDVGFTVLIDKRLSEIFKGYVNLGVVSPGDLMGNEKVNLKEFIHGGTAIEAAFWKNFSLLGQVFFQTSPFSKMHISSVDRLAVLLSLGGRHYSGNSSFEFSVTEDVNTSGAPDFTFNISFKRKF